MASVQVKKLSKRFERVEALRGISFEVKDGQFVALLGPSGAGKTTTLKLIAGVEVADAGEVWIGSKLMNDIAAEQRNTALVFENYALYPNMTVFNNLAFPLRAPGRGRKRGVEEIKRRVQDVAETLGIGEYLERQIWQLSGGQKQRVALGRALVRRPDAFLMDEPIAHLDAKLRFEMRAELKRLQRDIGVTTVYATPDYGEAMALADVVVVLRDGRVVQAGRPDSVFWQPANTYVAHLVGEPHINLLEMEVQYAGDSVNAMRDELKFELTPSQAATLRRLNARRVVVGIRPSEVVVNAGGANPRNMRAVVSAVEPRGSSTVVSLRAGGKEIVAKMPGDCGIRRESNAWITVNTETFILFHAESGMRIPIESSGAVTQEVSQ